MEESMEEEVKSKEARLTRRFELEKQREEILLERARLLSLRNGTEGQESLSRDSFSRSSYGLRTAVGRAKQQIPELERRVYSLQKAKVARYNALQRPYNGEMGIASYEPWQLEHFYFVRDFVRSWVDEVLDFVVRESPKEKTYDAVGAVAERFYEELEVEKENIRRLQLSLEIEKSVVTEVLYQEAKETVLETIALEKQVRNMLDNIILNALGSQVPENVDNSTHSLVGKVYFQLKKEGNKRGVDLWTHSQAFQLYDTSTGNDVQVKEEELFDGTVLHFHDITPFNDIPDEKLPAEQIEYQNEESEYWMANSVDLSTLPLPRRCKGISCSSVSADECLIAIGTVQGDIYIWDLLVYPPRILRASRGKSSLILDLQWSMDSSQIVSLNDYGTVQIWSLGDSTSVPYDIKSFEPIELNLGFKASALVCLLTLQPNDFLFTVGPFSDSKVLVSKVTAIAFHSSTTLFGQQGFLMVGFSNGNIQRLKLQNSFVSSSFPRVEPSHGLPHKIGKDIEAELFKSHSHPVVLIRFINNISPMVTVDDKGVINMWEYSSESLTGFGWFVPTVKYRLNMMEVTFEPVAGAEEKVIFSDDVSGPARKQQRLRQEMIQKRRHVKNHINSLRLGKPWQTDEVDDKITHIYAGKNVLQSGATFHCITYISSTGLLSSYITKPYKPTPVPCSKFISCMTNSSGTRLVFMLLFPEAAPREAHVSFVIINLDPVYVSKNYICISVSELEYVKSLRAPICSFSLSRTIGPTGSEYIVANINGRVTTVSMTSGNEVMAEAEPGWIGCHLKLKKGQIPAASKVQVASTCKGLKFLFYTKRHNSAVLMEVTDNSSKEQRLRTWEAFRQWKLGFEEGKKSVHFRLHTSINSCWRLSGHAGTHVECFMESLVLDMIDDAMQMADGSFTNEQKQTFHFENLDYPFFRRIFSQANDSHSGRDSVETA